MSSILVTNTIDRIECDEEKITFVPSTELIPDEYEHTEPNNGSVIIFYSRSDEDNKNLLYQTLSDQNYHPKVFVLSKKDEFLQNLSEVASEIHEKTTCLILFFLGSMDHSFLNNDTNQIIIKDIWSNFTGNKCPLLKTKPKIFVVQANKKPKQKLAFDHPTFQNHPKGAYDIPSEADMLLVFNKIENLKNQENFIEELCYRIKKFGKRDDVISLISRTNVTAQRPIVVSTLTRKFYFAFDQRRDYFYDIQRNDDIIKNELIKLREIFFGRETEAASTVKDIILAIDQKGTLSRSTDFEEKRKVVQEQTSTIATVVETEFPISKWKTVKDIVLAINKKGSSHITRTDSFQEKDSTKEVPRPKSILSTNKIQTEASTLKLKPGVSKEKHLMKKVPSSLKIIDSNDSPLDKKSTSHKSIELGIKTNSTQTNSSREKDSTEKIQKQTSQTILATEIPIAREVLVSGIDKTSNLQRSTERPTQTNSFIEKDSTRKIQKQMSILPKNIVETEVLISNFKAVRDMVSAIESREREAKVQTQPWGRFKQQQNKKHQN
ncbi:hypothetical protein FQR65_LT11622 [Abscondita terminalis]|nr:hypothetical protein FQR65_LT11622 [Abscondita terminalis]